MKRRSVFISILLIAASIFIRCASEAAPGGGPPDKTPPLLIDSNVKTGSTGIPADQEIVFYFSETINPDNIVKNVTLFPLGNLDIKVRTRGRSLSVSPIGSWDPNTVYTLIIAKGISDLRGNSINEPIQISFSPGNEIPKNAIKGAVMGLKNSGSATIALSRTYSHPDSILMYPEYYTQTGVDGSFSFNFLPQETFNIAGYIDMDKSNSYKAKFDGVCIPQNPKILPDTLNSILLMQSIYDNFIPGVLIKVESPDPYKTELVFSKNISRLNSPQNFSVDYHRVDTVIFNDNTCSAYHQKAQNDTFNLTIHGLVDQVGVNFADSVLLLPAVDLTDSFYTIEQLGNSLRIWPDPGYEKLDAVFQGRDTTNIILTKQCDGFYLLPQIKTSRQGTCLITLPFPNVQNVNDSTYAVDVSIAALPEYGSVLGTLDREDDQQLRLVLHRDKVQYDISARNRNFTFNEVLPGSYALSYYIDLNENGIRDLGHPYPHRAPELLFDLDEKIEVRARWDTDIEEPFKIVVENGK